jgi:hypothetical protein
LLIGDVKANMIEPAKMTLVLGAGRVQNMLKKKSVLPPGLIGEID